MDYLKRLLQPEIGIRQPQVYQLSKILIFGNSGSGKSTLAKKLVNEEDVAHLDLDSLAWFPETPQQRAPLVDCKTKLENFVNDNDD